jgi:hypothetical protein
MRVGGLGQAVVRPPPPALSLKERKKERSTPVSRRALRAHSVNEDHRCALIDQAARAVAREERRAKRETFLASLEAGEY